MLEDLFARRLEVVEELKTASGVSAVELQETLASLDRALHGPDKTIEAGAVVTGDELVDAWEAAVERGETPNLEHDWVPISRRRTSGSKPTLNGKNEGGPNGSRGP